MADNKEIKTEKKAVDKQKFKARKLKALNEMTNKAKAKFLKERLLNN